MSQEVAIFAGGCFWCMVHPFDQWPGVISVESGYTGGHVMNPSYEQVKTGMTGHTEAVKITYDPAIISYQKLLEVYWSVIDPTDLAGQFVDRGSSYRPEIFYTTPEQKELAEQSKEHLDLSQRFSKPIVVPITEATEFFVAEDYHQDFYKKNQTHYQRYRQGSGRDQFIERFQQ